MNSQWLECLCLVKFDIEIGQIVEWIQPFKSISEEEEKSISLLSFPDSNSFSQNEGHQKYVFRVRRSNDKNKFSFGFTLFMQKKDQDNPRGYTQKSIVILSNLPLVNFFYQVLEIFWQNITIGCMKAQLQTAYEQIIAWEKPQPNRLFNLGLFNSKIAVEVPYYLKMKKTETQENTNLQQVLEELTLSNMIQFDDLRDIGQFQETNLYATLPHSMLANLPKLWELVITNQPFMVMADSPSQGCEIVLGIISLMSPMHFSGDYRPYFTIYDREFQQINSELENSIVRNIVIGVTNPFFLKSYQKFPIILRCDQVAGNQRLQFQQNKEFCLLDDKQTLKMLIPIKNEETKAINNSLLKKIYRNMTLEFVGLFEMYFASQQNQVKKFDEKEFIEFLKGCKLSFSNLFENKQKFIKLYTNFIRSQNFVTYLNGRKNVYIPKYII